MRIEITIGRWAEEYMAGTDNVPTVGSYTMELPNNATIKDAIVAAGIPYTAVGFATIAGTAVRKDSSLKDGDIVALYPPIVGG